MNYVIAICLLYMVVLFVVIATRLIFTTRKDRWNKIKNFKRGDFVAIYLVVVPLFFVGFRYAGDSVGDSLWKAIGECFNVVTLKFSFSGVSALLEASALYKVAIYLLFSLSLLNAIVFTLSFCGLYVLNGISSVITRWFRKKVVVVVGYNKNSLDILSSVTRDNGKAILLGEISPKMREDAIVYHADCANFSSSDNLGEKLSRMFGKFDRKRVSVILNCENDAASLLYVKQLCKLIADKKLTELELASNNGLYVYVLGARENESTFVHYVEKSQGLIRFVNRHTQIAMDFVDRYPMTKFMTSEHLDTEKATVKEDVKLNVFMLGFGRFNETLFLTSVSNNQFLTTDANGNLRPKTVNYHLYDRNYPEGKITEENDHIMSYSLNHGYKRYEDFLAKNEQNSSQYLEFVPRPAETVLHSYDFSHPGFYDSLEEELSQKNSFNYIIISFGTDLENVELAKKLQQKIREWKVSSVVNIFAKVEDTKLVHEIEDDFNLDNIHIYGTNKDVVYNASKILNEKYDQMARRRHILYTAEYANRKNLSTNISIDDKNIKDVARKTWYGYRQFQRESNVFACLSIRMKLQLMGYDYADKSDASVEDCSREFMEKYERGNPRRPLAPNIDGKSVYDYVNDEQFNNSLRWTYAVLEHQRWCANMVCNGLVPASIEQIKENGGRMPDKRLHGNLTTMKGLVQFRKIVAEQTKQTEEETDVIRYDFQLMDDVVWLLNKCGYKLIKKQKGTL